MRNGLIGFLGTVTLAALATNGCGSSTSSGGASGGGNNGTGGSTQPANTQNCTNGSPCGGSVEGTWNVTSSSCLQVSGELDVSLAGLGCATVPATGSLQITGAFTATAGASYTDQTTTTGTVTFPLAAKCLTISSVPVTCAKAGTIFAPLGWATSACTDTNGQCNCTLTANQHGGLGYISGESTSGSYETSGNTLTMDNQKTYSYCVSGNALSVTPQLGGITGTVVLQKSGTVAGTGGASSTGGQPSTGGGPAAGGAPQTGGAPSAGGAATGGAAAGGAATGGKTGAGGGALGGASGVGGAATGGATGAGGKTNVGGSAAGGTSPTGGKTNAGGTTTSGGASVTGGTTGAGGAGGGSPGPCDIYAAASVTCVAAHSTIRLLVGSYSGALYQVYRASDKTTKDIPVLSGTIYADSSVQDTFCQGTTCTITKLYDQTGHGNFVEAETPTNPVSSVGGYTGQTAANATAEKLTVGGHSVYSLYTTTRQAYWRDGSKTSIPLGAAPQGIYMVTSGTHFNNGCCYDYGNGETTRTYVAGPSMDAISFMGNTNGSAPPWGTGAGSGPWVMADLEGGVFSGATTGNNTNNPSQTAKYVTAMEKNNGTTAFALRGADATAGTLGTYYSGALPAGKNPMKKQGSIILGSGGDCCYSNNNASIGTFYEGAIVAGYPSDATDAAIQANIVSAQYGK